MEIRVCFAVGRLHTKAELQNEALMFNSNRRCSYVWSIRALIKYLLVTVGHTDRTLIGLGYDWRLTPNKMQIRDDLFTRWKVQFEATKSSTGSRGVVVAHSMGNLVFRSFLMWMEETFYKDEIAKITTAPSEGGEEGSDGIDERGEATTATREGTIYDPKASYENSLYRALSYAMSYFSSASSSSSEQQQQQPAGFYAYRIPPGVEDGDDIAAPELLADGDPFCVCASSSSAASPASSSSLASTHGSSSALLTGEPRCVRSSSVAPWRSRGWASALCP